jgi:hypothetical protein
VNEQLMVKTTNLASEYLKSTKKGGGAGVMSTGVNASMGVMDTASSAFDFNGAAPSSFA